MLKKIFSSPVTWILALVGVYFLYTRSKSGVPLFGTNDPIGVTRVPPPGYSGPAGGPFTWAGIGPAPDGKNIVIGNVVT